MSMRTRAYPDLRLVRPDGSLVEPRRKDQSISSNPTSSHRTAPALSRSIDMAIPAPNRCPVEIALRKYPSVVPQRHANDARAVGSRVSRNRRSTSIAKCLPTGNLVSIPVGHLPFGNDSYDAYMDGKTTKFDIRVERVKELIKQAGSQANFAEKIGRPPNYVSRILSKKTEHRKNIGEDLAHEIEVAFGKEDGWLSKPKSGVREKSASYTFPRWPFKFDPERWDHLSDEDKADIEKSVLRQMLGIESEAATKSTKRKIS